MGGLGPWAEAFLAPASPPRGPSPADKPASRWRLLGRNPSAIAGSKLLNRPLGTRPHVQRTPPGPPEAQPGKQEGPRGEEPAGCGQAALSGELMALGSEHLGQMRKRRQLMAGWGSSKEPLLSALLRVQSCSRHQTVVVLDLAPRRAPEPPRRGLPLGAGVLPQTHGVPVGGMGEGGPGRAPQVERCALLSINIDTNTGRRLWEKVLYTKVPFSGGQGF